RADDQRRGIRRDREDHLRGTSRGRGSPAGSRNRGTGSRGGGARSGLQPVRVGSVDRGLAAGLASVAIGADKRLVHRQRGSAAARAGDSAYSSAGPAGAARPTGRWRTRQRGARGPTGAADLVAAAAGSAPGMGTPLTVS